MQALEQLLNEQIRVLQVNGRLAIVWSLSLFTVGLLATIVLYYLPATQSLGDLAKVGPGVIMAAISSIQFKTIAVSRERLSFLRTLREQIAGTNQLESKEKETIVEMVIDAIKESGKR
ncbi:MAG: hypothetical protein ACFFCW_20800 [Candidatus Hodarchaeota archaeon]